MMKTQKPIIILGGGGHASVVKELIELNSGRIKGYTDAKVTGLAAVYLGEDHVIERFKPSQVQLAMGVGSNTVSVARKSIFDKFSKLGYHFVTLVHPKAVISATADLGEGTQVMAAVVINPNVKTGKNVIINSSAIIDHDCFIGDHSHIAPGVCLSGGVKIGINCLIGVGATVIQGINIGNKVLVAAGAVVIKNVSDAQTVAGVPAKVILNER